VSGSPNFDSSLYTRVDGNSTDYTRKRSGKIVETGRRVLSKDGNTLTFTAQGTDAKAQKFTYTTVFERQP
jgi:hypothetical protein